MLTRLGGRGLVREAPVRKADPGRGLADETPATQASFLFGDPRPTLPCKGGGLPMRRRS